jgi:Cu/Ag efflux pump CusA
MKRIATPMVGVVGTSTLKELLIYPAIFYLWQARGFKQVIPEKLEYTC